MRNVLLSILLISYWQYVSVEKIVRLPQGNVASVNLTSRKGRVFLGFVAIPYAEPPIGDLRFRSPVPKKPWNDVIRGGNRSIKCVQVDKTGKLIGDEDCLFLNVYIPLIRTKKKELLAVMVYIYGGSYTNGGAFPKDYSPDFLLDHDIVLVLMNYRLGPLGFLSSGDSALPGNFGLKDGVLALKWVQENIHFFGGDRNRVTIFGESAGAGYASLLVLSEVSQGLFHQYITQSGAAINPWAVHKEAEYYQNPKKLAEKYNCPIDSDKMVECLRKLTPAQVMNLTFTLPKIIKDPKYRWGPTIEPKSEDAVITEDPLKLLKEGKAKDCRFITGVVHDEGLLYSSILFVNNGLYEKYANNIELVISEYLQYSNWGTYKNVTALVKAIKEFYFPDEILHDKDLFNANATNFIGDFLFYYGINVQTRYIEGSNTEPFYYYNFDYLGTRSRTMFFTKDNSLHGVCHADDLFYLFNVPDKRVGITLNKNAILNNEKIIDIVTSLWTSFAITGVPSLNYMKDSPVWKPYLPTKSIFVIGNSTEPVTSVRYAHESERMNFWYKHLPM